MEYRFAIGSKSSPVSCTWKLWNWKNEIYLLQRNRRNSAKFSFHSSGRCRWATNENLRSGEDRAFLKWVREDVGSLRAGYGSVLLHIAFPTNHLSTNFPLMPGAVAFIPPAADGKATGLDIFATRESKQEVLRHFKDSPRILRFYGKLLNGSAIAVASCEFECGPVDLRKSREPVIRGQVFGELVFPDFDSTNSGRPVRMIMTKGEPTPPTVWELGGYEAKPLMRTTV